MEPTILLFLTSGLFLGWSLGSNDAANVFGTAVGSRMVRFSTAVAICGIFVILGAVLGGAGAAHGLGRLGAVNALPGSFTVALSAAVTVYMMSKFGLPVSTTQAIVGAIVGWNLFSGSLTDLGALARIVGTWIACPILGAVFAVILYRVTLVMIRVVKPHLLKLDLWTRIGLVIAGAFGSYALGANNIANVMGVFVPVSPFEDLRVGDLFTLTSVQQLFLLGAIAIAIGVFYSRRVMMTVGTNILPVSPVAAWVAVISHSLVLFIFSSAWLQQLLVGWGLPAIPLVPVSSSQAVVGAVIGIGLCHGLKGARQINWSVLASIGSGWVSTPLISAIVCFFLLFFMQNVFQQRVYEEVPYVLSTPGLVRLEGAGVDTAALEDLRDREVGSAREFRRAVRRQSGLRGKPLALVLETAEVYRTRLDEERIEGLDPARLTGDQLAGVRRLTGRSYEHRWQLIEALADQGPPWRPLPESAINNPNQKAFNNDLRRRQEYILRFFHDRSS